MTDLVSEMRRFDRLLVSVLSVLAAGAMALGVGAYIDMRDDQRFIRDCEANGGNAWLDGGYVYETDYICVFPGREPTDA